MVHYAFSFCVWWLVASSTLRKRRMQFYCVSFEAMQSILFLLLNIFVELSSWINAINLFSKSYLPDFLINPIAWAVQVTLMSLCCQASPVFKCNSSLWSPTYIVPPIHFRSPKTTAQNSFSKCLAGHLIISQSSSALLRHEFKDKKDSEPFCPGWLTFNRLSSYYTG